MVSSQTGLCAVQVQSTRGKRSKGGGENEGGKDTVYLIAGYQGVSFSTTSWLCSYIGKCGKRIF